MTYVYLLALAGGITAAWFAFRGTEKANGSKGPAETNVNLVELSDKIEPVLEKVAHPGDILSNKDFEKAVDALCSESFTAEQVRNYALGGNWVLSCVGFEALARRDDSAVVIDRVLNSIKSTFALPMYFLLKFLESRAREPVCATILSNAQHWWRYNPAVLDAIEGFVARKTDEGETVEFGSSYADLDTDDRESVREFIRALAEPVRSDLLGCLDKYEGEAVDRAFLKTVGEFITRDDGREPVFNTGQTERLMAELLDEIKSATPRSILLVGPSGVGKSAMRSEFANLLLERRWLVFRTSATQLIADKKYVGEIEGQVRNLVQNASVSKKVALYVDRISDLSEYGNTSDKRNSVLDQLWPEIESRKILLVSETTPAGLQVLARTYPALPIVMKVVKIDPVPDAEAEEIAGELLEYLQAGLGSDEKKAIVAETLQLSQQYLTHKSLPGSILSLLKLAVHKAKFEESADRLQRTHVLDALSQLTGLPSVVLDEHQQLDIEALRESFRHSVIGQDEGIDCLVERITMLKAGVTDPTRPVGVFMFAGPTGTGKTEIAKTLANLLFGSPDQMIRLDMSEYQESDSVWRLLGQSPREIASGSLVNRIREQPFSVLLLDEFEKAHAKVWDVFLQVFDDGRLSDARGELADFRHAIIILTSNLGATISNEAGVGFTSTGGGFSSADVLRIVNRTFRREFINRLDRVVVFQPLSREIMRAILYKELDKALGRRGLRSRQWAVEWEDSAIEYLLSKGFTPDLGARPLRRAIERHLLAPLSVTIVQNRVPEGEQFLFVRSDGDSLQVEFIDPDAEPDDVAEPEDATESDTPSGDSLGALILNSSSDSNTTDWLVSEMSAISDRVSGDKWIEAKAQYLEELNDGDFWTRPDRHVVLDRIELIDRLDSAASVLGSLTNRLRQHPGNSKLIRSIANRLHVLKQGLDDLDLERPTQAYLGIRLVTADVELQGAASFRQSLVAMYKGWAKARGMRIKALDTSGSRYEVLFSVSGFGSHGVLAPESGLHVFEIPKNKGRFERIRARVQVAPVPIRVSGGQNTISGEATRKLDEAAPDKIEIVRRYREQPSPLARDSVRGWRTGRLDLVLKGNFDVIA